MIERLREREENRSVIKHIRELVPGSVPEIRGRDVAVLSVPCEPGRNYIISTSAVAENVRDAWDEALYRYICSGAMPDAARIRLLLRKGAGETEAKKEAAVANGLAELDGRRIQILALDVNLSNSLDENACEVTFIGGTGTEPYESAKDKKSLFGLKLVHVGNAGAYGSRLLYENNMEELEKVYGLTISEIAQMRLKKKPRPETVLDVIRKHEDVKLVKACGYGGTYGALWQLSQIIGTGLNVKQRSIPILQETVEVAEHFNQNPYMLYSSGSWVVICREAEQLVGDFVNIGIPAEVTGTISEQEACLIEESGRHLTPVE